MMPIKNRREFLKKSLLAGALPLLPIEMWPQSNQSAPIALQLWTVREPIEQDLANCLMRIKDLGYHFVETAFWPEHISLSQGAQAIKQAGLKVCSMHCEIDQMEQWVALSEAYECKNLIWHGWPEDSRYKTEQGIQELADLYNRAFEFADKHRLKFGLHNHWWEFQQDASGQYPWAQLIPRLHPEIFLEIDTYWVKVAGQDPARIIAELGARAPFLHIKDGPARYTDSLGKDEPEPMVAVGRGTQNFPEMVEAAAGHTKWMIVEMDRVEQDVFQAIADSFEYLVQNKLARTH